MEIRVGWSQTDIRLVGEYGGTVAPYVEVVATEYGEIGVAGANSLRVVMTWPITGIEGIIAQLRQVQAIDNANRQVFLAKIEEEHGKPE